MSNNRERRFVEGRELSSLRPPSLKPIASYLNFAFGSAIGANRHEFEAVAVKFALVLTVEAIYYLQYLRLFGHKQIQLEFILCRAKFPCRCCHSAVENRKSANRYKKRKA